MSGAGQSVEERDTAAKGTDPPALEVSGLSAGYGGAAVLRGVDLVVEKGEVVALLGPNGAGKTTLLKVVSGLLAPTAGTIRLAGMDVTRTSAHRRSQRGLCHVPEGRGIFRNLTVRENIRLQSVPGEEEDGIERSQSAFPILGERLEQTAGTLSGGQQQMLAMAAAYVRSPDLVLIDEASLGLAPIIVDEIFAFLADLAKGGASLLLVDQFAHRALEMGDRVYILRRGEIVHSGSSEEMLGTNLVETYLS